MISRFLKDSMKDVAIYLGVLKNPMAGLGVLVLCRHHGVMLFVRLNRRPLNFESHSKRGLLNVKLIESQTIQP